MPLTPQEMRSALSASFWKAKTVQEDTVATTMKLQRPSEAQIKPTQTVRQQSSNLDAEPSLWNCLKTRYPSKAQITKNCLEAAKKPAAFIDQRLPGFFRLFFHGKKTKRTREARAANEPVAPTPMAIEEELAKKQMVDELTKQMVDLHKLALAYGAKLQKQNEELGKGYYNDEAREVDEEVGEKKA